MRSVFNVATALVLGSLIISAKPSVAETPLRQFQQSSSQDLKAESKTLPSDNASENAEASAGILTGTVTDPEEDSLSLPPPTHYVATAYSLRGRTASGRFVSKGIIAADRRVLPLGSRVRLDAGGYSGEYLVADTGVAIRGKRIDIWTPSSREAMRFGRRTVKLTVLSYPANTLASAKNKRASR